MRRLNARRGPTSPTSHLNGTRYTFRLYLVRTRQSRIEGSARDPQPTAPHRHRNRAYGLRARNLAATWSLVARELPRSTAASARRSDPDNAATVVRSDRALALNLEMARSWKVKPCVRMHQVGGAWQRIYSSTTNPSRSRAVPGTAGERGVLSFVFTCPPLARTRPPRRRRGRRSECGAVTYVFFV